MIRALLLLLLTSVISFGANILSYNIYDRSERVDVMLTFDTPYEGKIVKSRHNSKIVLKLYNAKIESTKIKQVSSKFLKTLSISPMSGFTQIVADVPSSDVILRASKTSDGYGLRLRFTKRAASKNVSALPLKSKAANSAAPSLSTLPTKKSGELSTSYYIVVSVLVVGIIILLLLKRKIASSSEENMQKGWLFKASSPKAPTMKQNKKATPKTQDATEVSIRFQKSIDEKNSVVMLDFQHQSYLLLLGEHNNILLEKFHDNVPATQGEFESLLEEKNSELEQFLQVGTSTQETQPKQDILKSFSQKASNIPYNL